ncbi:MAG: hypothetical protein ACI89X_004898 [Planctomycetota bacterium]|jgi:hypothetical protein
MHQRTCGESTTCVEPSRQVFFNEYATRASGSSDNRLSAIAGRPAYLHKCSSRLRSPAATRTAACNEKPSKSAHSGPFTNGSSRVPRPTRTSRWPARSPDNATPCTAAASSSSNSCPPSLGSAPASASAGSASSGHLPSAAAWQPHTVAHAAHQQGNIRVRDLCVLAPLHHTTTWLARVHAIQPDHVEVHVQPQPRIESLHKRHRTSPRARLAEARCGTFVVTRNRAHQDATHGSQRGRIVRAHKPHPIRQGQPPRPHRRSSRDDVIHQVRRRRDHAPRTTAQTATPQIARANTPAGKCQECVRRVLPNFEFKDPTGSATTTASPPRSFARLRQREPWPAPSTNSKWQAMLDDATRGP